MFSTLTSLFKELLDGRDLGQTATATPDLAIACLLSEVAGADHQLDPREKDAKCHFLTKLLGIDTDAANSLIAQAEQRRTQSASLYEFTTQLRELSQEQRFELIKGMWEVAYADGTIDPLEEAVIRKTAELIYVDHSQFIRAKLQVIGK
ncbi:hypothetical protein HGP28_16050 [Vibrio sp. SM6]|uniref:Co-chaperone DjlA N-terminal domain-containing protein n=1 Tax=Vibrio agarilyticus TaxID=2726741 RepID=A0A7X8YHR9_9VIBR|nr:TerB family tellurite resistance protein [Vibrio agarilyticus]NLS14393.1 hypothetical protein [Vibrio agarilyticus]